MEYDISGDKKFTSFHVIKKVAFSTIPIPKEDSLSNTRLKFGLVLKRGGEGKAAKHFLVNESGRGGVE